MTTKNGILGRGEMSRTVKLLRATACFALAAQLMVTPLALGSDRDSDTKAGDSGGGAAAAASDLVLKTMQAELARATSGLAKSDPAPYFLSYSVYDQNVTILAGAYGSLLTDTAVQRRQADVTMRVGSAALDNTHGQARASGMSSGSLPFGEDQDAISHVLWELTDREYKRAAPTFLNVKTNTAVRAEEEDKSPDFSKEASVQHTGEALTVPAFDKAGWEGEIRRLSGEFRKYPDIYFASVVLQVQSANERMVNSEGTAITSPSNSTRLVMEAQTRAEDGMDLLRVETFQAPSAAGLPSEKELSAKIEKMATDLNALRKAPVAEPYDGPA